MTNLEICIREEEVCEQVGVIVEVDRLVLLLLSLQFSTFSSYEENKYIFAAKAFLAEYFFTPRIHF
jgi:hypothetical protein